MPRGAYHFYYFCRTAEDQARWFIRHVPRDRSALPPVLDMEWNPQSPTCKLRPDAATVRSEMKTFLTMVERHYGKKPIIYTSVDFFDDNDLVDVPRLSLLAALRRRPPERQIWRPSLHLLAIYRHRQGARREGQCRRQRLQRQRRGLEKVVEGERKIIN